MAKTTIASLEARIIILEAALADRGPKPQAPAAPKLAQKTEPTIRHYTNREGVSMESMRVGNVTRHYPVQRGAAPSPSMAEVDYDGCPEFDDEGSNYYIGE